MRRSKQTFESVAAMFSYLRDRLDSSDGLLLRVPQGVASDLRCGVDHFILNREQLEALLNDGLLRRAETPFTVVDVPLEITPEVWAKQRLATEKDYPLTQPFYGKVRDLLNAGERLPFPELPEELTAMIYALIDHRSFYSGFWAASMERLTGVQFADPAPVSTNQESPKQYGYQGYTPEPIEPRPRRERPSDRDIMRRQNMLVKDADGRLLVKIRRHRHLTAERLALQVDVLKENQQRWPGEIAVPSNAEQIRRGATVQCRVDGVTKIFVVVPEVNIGSKGHLQILIEVLEASLDTWRQFVQRGAA